MNNSTQTYRIVDDANNTIDDLKGLSLSDAEHHLCRCLNFGANAYIQDEAPNDHKGGFAAIVEHLTNLIHHNLHNEALIATAAYFKQNDLVKTFEGYLSEQAHMGYMTNDAIARRDNDKKRLLDSIELMHDLPVRKLFSSLL
jgi:hypothetical protein